MTTAPMTTAAALIAELEPMARPDAIPSVSRFFAGRDSQTTILGVPIGSVFPVAKRYKALALPDICHLLDDSRYEIRMAGVSVMDFQAREKKISDASRKALFDLYLERHDRINNWDLVDRAAPWVIGEYLVDRDRSVLEGLARSPDPHRRRTALVATYAFLRRKDTEWTFRIADLLAGDTDTYVQKAIASWTREAGKTAPDALKTFLDKNANVLPRTTVREASKGVPL